MIELMMKVTAGAAAALLCTSVLRRNAPEFVAPVILAVGVWIVLQCMRAAGSVLQSLDRLTELAGLDRAVMAPVLRVVCLSLITRVSSEVCRGAGESGIAAFVETAGTVLAVAASLPLVEAVIKMVSGLTA